MTELRKRFVERVEHSKFGRSVLIVVVHLPSGAYETIVNYDHIADKIDYYISAYDDDFKLKANPNIKIVEFILL